MALDALLTRLEARDVTPAVIETRLVPVILRDEAGYTREAVLVVTEQGEPWPVSWIEWPSEGNA